jgi:hypothetical protein
MTIAQAKWGTPTCGQPQLLVRAPSAYEREYATSLNGRSPVAWADVDHCAIIVNPEYRIYTAARRCHVIVHEWGHLAGYRDPANTADPLHSRDPRSVMYARDEISETPRFRGRGHAQWVAVGAYPPCYERNGRS